METKDPKFINGIVIDGVFYEYVSTENKCEQCGLKSKCDEIGNDLCEVFTNRLGYFINRGIGGYYVPKQTTAPANGIDELQDLIKKNKEMSDKLKDLADEQMNFFNVWQGLIKNSIK